MFLMKKRVSFIIPVLTWAYEEIVEEIRQLAENGARVRTFLFLANSENLRNFTLDWGRKLEYLTGKEPVILQEDFNLDNFKDSDIIVIAPCPYILWEKLIHLRIPDNLSLVIAPYGEDKEESEFISLLNLLLRKERTYFVPFGPVVKKVKGLPPSKPVFISRFDLVAETALAAALKNQIQPVIFEFETLPG